QLLITKEQRMEHLRRFVPDAKTKDCQSLVFASGTKRLKCSILCSFVISSCCREYFIKGIFFIPAHNKVTILFRLFELTKSVIETCFKNFSPNPAKGPNNKMSLLSI